jgi:hypothetical protein
MDRGNYEEAVEMLESCVALRRAALEASNAQTRECMNELDNAMARMP